jgi:hypothetical protein
MLKNTNSTCIAVSLVLACFLQSQAVPNFAIAAGSSIVSEGALTKSVAEMESRFFAREYVNDPLEKRLERLELLVFGSTQDGDNVARYSRLKQSVAQKKADEQAAKKAEAGAAGGAAKPPSSSAQYNALKTLEWRAFKKTYPSETLDQRLSRLEKKVFGADNPAMAYVDRVDRLNRTLNVDVSPVTPRTIVGQRPMPLGPAPKARPHGQGMPDSWSFGGGTVSPRDLFSDDDDGVGGGFGNFGGLGGFGLNRTMSTMLREMDRQMALLQQLPSGSYTMDPKTGEWIERNSGKRIKPGMPSQIAPPTFKAPKLQRVPSFTFPQGDSSTIPPYSDPNSI